MLPAALLSETPSARSVLPKWSSEFLKLHIGCGNQKLQGYVNCDLHRTKGADVMFDGTQPWPFPDSSISMIYTSHTLEHLHDFHAFFREAHRVLQPEGALQIRVPYGGHGAAYWDVSHVRPWFAETFCFVQPGYEESVSNAQHRHWQHFFSVDDVMLRLSGRIVPWMRWKLMRRLLLPWLDCFWNVIEEVWVYLVALKSEERIRDWTLMRRPNAVPARYMVYRHHLEGRALGHHEAIDFVTLGGGELYNAFHSWQTGAP